MALTSLESIAEKIAEKKKLDMESILRISGSAAISKNEYGITVVTDEDAPSSLLFKKLNKIKYDKEELIKAIDVEVKELKPNIPEVKRDLVPKPLYDEQVATNATLTQQISDLNTTISDLTTKVSDLEAKLQSEINNRLSIEQINDTLVNQIETLNKTINEFANQISIALQKSIEESILRTSLQAQNSGFQAQIKALIKQIDSLNSIIEGLQAQLGAVQQQQAIVQGTQAEALAAGADVVNDVVVVKLKAEEDIAQPPIYAKISSGGGNKWINGKGITFTNNDKKEISVKIDVTFIGPRWFRLPESTFVIPSNGTKDIDLVIDEVAAAPYDSKAKGGWFGGHTGTQEYDGNNLIITIIRADGVQKSKEYKLKLTKCHPKSF